MGTIKITFYILSIQSHVSIFILSVFVLINLYISTCIYLFPHFYVYLLMYFHISAFIDWCTSTFSYCRISTLLNIKSGRSYPRSKAGLVQDFASFCSWCCKCFWIVVVFFWLFFFSFVLLTFGNFWKVCILIAFFYHCNMFYIFNKKHKAVEDAVSLTASIFAEAVCMESVAA